MGFSASFLGVGSANSALGNACCLIECNLKPWLMIDCGHHALHQYHLACGDSHPEAVFITHLHFDHIGGLEQLFYRAFTSSQPTPTLYVPAPLVAQLCQILGNSQLAEGGVNVWDKVKLVPVLNEFWHKGILLRVHAARHHKPNSAFSLHFPGVFFYSGDTKSVPEVLHHCVMQDEVIFHDAGIEENPSHSDIRELQSAYSKNVLDRLVVYHYHSEKDANDIEQLGFRVARVGQRFTLESGQSVTPLSLKQA